MTKQGILLLTRARQPHLRKQPVKVYVNDQNIHSLQGGEQDSFFIDSGIARVTLKAGMFGSRSLKLQVQPNQKYIISTKINISTLEFWLRILSLVVAVGFVLYELVFPPILGLSSFSILLTVVILNLVLNINRLHVKTDIVSATTQIPDKVL